MPGTPVKFDPPSEWKSVTNVLCGKCGKRDVQVRTHESSCGGWEDDEFKCLDCGHTWWVDGIDS